MTAEIAILNRIGVALAADSAVTISSPQGAPKTYNSADKLFQLNGNEPVAIMIHGSAEFMGIPAETIIKGFCASSYNTPQPELSGYVRQFLEFMHRELPIERKTMIARIASITVDALVGIRTQAETEYEARTNPTSNRKPRPSVFMARRVQDIIAQTVEDLRRAPEIPGISEDNLPYLELAEVVREAIVTVLGDGMLAKMELILELVKLMLLRDISLGGEIGFVFAGFGTDQIFPAIAAVECELALVGALRVKNKSEERISSEQVAVIMPFAQSEMVERFMDGVEASYNVFVREAVRGALTAFGNEVAARTGTGESKSKKLAKALERLRDDYVTELDRAALSFRAAAYRHKILEVVQFMPKFELAEMAESLVNLTSIKRRVSAEHETVGGPIDVAFVSKYDGFTWIRRKGISPRPPESSGSPCGNENAS